MWVSSRSILMVLGVAATALQAEAPRYGVQGLVNLPLSDLKTYVDKNPGIGLGVHGTFDLGDGHMLRPRLDYSIFQQATVAAAKQDASCLGLGGDYLYFIAGKPEGLYFTAGLAAVRWTFRHQDPGSDLTDDTTKAGIAAGIGYQWDYNIGTEARWLHSSVSNAFKADSLQVAVTFRF